MEVVFEYEKQTKNTYRYMEKTELGKPPMIKTLYVQKWAFAGNPPEKIKVKIEF